MNQNVAKGLYVAGVTTFCTFLGCWAVLAHQETSQASRKIGVANQEFARKAAQGGMAEVKWGHLAEEKASNEAVKRFAKSMVEDHTKANDELKEVAAKGGLTLPTDLDAKDQATYDSLSKLSGDTFDRAYAQIMVKHHQQDVAEFRREANSGRKDALNTFAAQTLPTLQAHLKEAQQMEKSVSGTRSAKARRSVTHPSSVANPGNQHHR